MVQEQQRLNERMKQEMAAAANQEEKEEEQLTDMERKIEVRMRLAACHRSRRRHCCRVAAFRSARGAREGQG